MNKEKEQVVKISQRLIDAQKKILILDALKWTDDVKNDFFANKFKKQPNVTPEYYQNNPLPYQISDKKDEFKGIIRDVENQFGHFSPLSRLVSERCHGYILALDMLNARGTAEFSTNAIALYGSPKDMFYANGPRLIEMGTILFDLLSQLDVQLHNAFDDKIYTAEASQAILTEKLSTYFKNGEAKVKVVPNNAMVADASAGADTLRLNDGVMFSLRDLRCLEVHEGWVHIGTTLNGASQPYCHFLSKGSPACSVLQEGLAVLIEVVTGSSYPARLRKITNRVLAMDKVMDGATFLDIFQYFLACGDSEEDSYDHAVRIFRGSTPTCGPFTKDLSYAKGFMLVYTFIMYAIAEHQVDVIDLLFVGKINLEDIPLLIELRDMGLLEKPKFLPPPIFDKAGLSSWMSIFLYLDKFDFKEIQRNFRFLLPAK